MRYTFRLACSVGLLGAAVGWSQVAAGQAADDAEPAETGQAQVEEADEGAELPAGEESADESETEANVFGLVLDETSGPRIMVLEVAEGGLADEAGLKKGDEITRIDDRPVGPAAKVDAALLGVEPGESLSLEVFREGQSIAVTLKAPQEGRPAPGGRRRGQERADAGFSGMFLREVSPRRVMVMRVSPNTPAEAAGIKVGDELVAVDRKRAAPLDKLIDYSTQLFDTLEAGQAVPVTIRRDGEEAVVELVVAEKPIPQPQLDSDHLVPTDVLTTIGLAVLERPSNTLRVSAVVAHSPAAVAGIERGDVIRALAGQPVGSAAELSAVISMHQRGDVVGFELIRGREPIAGSITLRAEPATTVDYVRALQDQVDALARTVEALSKELEAMRGETPAEARRPRTQ